MRQALLFFLLFLCAARPAGVLAEDDTRVGRIRAALLYYVAKFVTFPKPDKTPFEICVIGKDPLNDFLPETIDGKTAQQRTIEARFLEHVKSFDELRNCTIVFFGAEEQQTLASFLERAHAQQSLSVCATGAPTTGVCMIQVFEEHNRARIGIDTKVLEQHGFRASSELLEVSVVR